MCIGSKFVGGYVPNIYIDHSIIELVKKHKYLGFNVCDKGAPINYFPGGSAIW